MEYHEMIVRRMADLCREKGISYNKLATLCGLRQSTIDNIVRGISKNPRIQTLHKIANALNMTVAEFLDYAELNAYVFEEDDEA